MCALPYGVSTKNHRLGCKRDVKLQLGTADLGLKTNVEGFQGGHYWPDMTPQRSHLMT
ncbi:hypothetical protein DPMN_095012 [Dreissena polymorpha]|uniref:Uncharacterized protein n=1 Tax=Dreissena polymorpha TaxID=45954 RepID=A0A9D4L5Q2_DREPO|nr:hypothetical protein DPMN_095012 [Dreissena polymorpha]